MILHYLFLPLVAILVIGAVFGFLACFDAWLQGTQDVDNETPAHDYHTGVFHLLYHIGQNYEVKRLARLDARDKRRETIIRIRGGQL